MSTMKDVTAGFTILQRYVTGRDEVCADHDIIWAGPEGLDENEISAADQEALEELGWHFDDRPGRWAVHL